MASSIEIFMSNETWRPEGAPDLTRDFTKNDHQQDKSEPLKSDSLSPAQMEYARHQSQSQNKANKEQTLESSHDNRPATKVELEALLNQRSKPEPACTYDIGGNTQAQAVKQTDLEREQRIQKLVERLAPMQNRARDDFNLNADDRLPERDKQPDRGR